MTAMARPRARNLGVVGMLRQFVDSFGDHGFFGSGCAPSYDPYFTDEATPAVVQAGADMAGA